MSYKLTIYQNEADRANIAELQTVLASQGLDLTDQRGNQSISALVRYLVQKELDERTNSPRS